MNEYAMGKYKQIEGRDIYFSTKNFGKSKVEILFMICLSESVIKIFGDQDKTTTLIHIIRRTNMLRLYYQYLVEEREVLTCFRVLYEVYSNKKIFRENLGMIDRRTVNVVELLIEKQLGNELEDWSNYLNNDKLGIKMLMMFDKSKYVGMTINQVFKLND